MAFPDELGYDPNALLDPWDLDGDEPRPMDDFDEIARVDWAENYDWSQTSFFLHRKSGRLFEASDSGCSCRSPFEDFRVSHLTEVTSLKQVDEILEYYAEDAEEIYSVNEGTQADRIYRARNVLRDYFKNKQKEALNGTA